VRPRTTSELTTALRRRGFAEDVVAEVLGRYREVGMVDDAAFARAWVSSRHHGRGLGQRVLADELLRRGIDAALVDDALIQVAGDVETQTARQLVRSWLHREAAAADPAPEQTFRRLVARLIRKGYPVGIACSAVKDELVDVPIPDDLDVDLIEAQLREQDG
jgi:regulatory protein